jgi:hypothetical protein
VHRKRQQKRAWRMARRGFRRPKPDPPPIELFFEEPPRHQERQEKAGGLRKSVD